MALHSSRGLHREGRLAKPWWRDDNGSSLAKIWSTAAGIWVMWAGEADACVSMNYGGGWRK
jgi:phage gp37-like protein